MSADEIPLPCRCHIFISSESPSPQLHLLLTSDPGDHRGGLPSVARNFRFTGYSDPRKIWSICLMVALALILLSSGSNFFYFIAMIRRENSLD